MADQIDEKVADMSLEEKKTQAKPAKKEKAAKKKGKGADASSEPLEVIQYFYIDLYSWLYSFVFLLQT